MYAELKRLGVVFVSKNEQFDTSSAIGEAMLKIILVFAELERNMTSERVSAVMLSRATSGQWNGGRVPYGYKRDDEEFVFDDEEAEIVKRISSEYLGGSSILEIARGLNVDGIKTRGGKEWSTTGVHKILKNNFYIGDYTYNVHEGGSVKPSSEWVTIENHHVALLTRSAFNETKRLLVRNRRGGVIGESYTNKNIHIFAGLIRCGSCGANMVATIDRPRSGNWRPSVYGCSTRRRNNSACQNKYISDITVGPFIFALVGAMLKAQKQVTKSTAIETLKKRFISALGVEDIDGLEILLNALKQGLAHQEYRPDNVFASDQSPSEKDLLLEQKRKNTIALNRLQTLYLYSDGGMSEREFVVERKRIQDENEEIDKRLEAIEASDTPSVPELQESYVIMSNYLSDPSKVDYEKFAKSVDPKIPKNFFRTIIDHMDALNGKIVSVTFMNGLTLKFSHQ